MTKRKKIALTSLVAAIALVAITVGLNQFSKAKCIQWTGEITCRVETQQKIVALTFDDGPTPEGVEAVLPMLAQYDARATFFLIGKHMKQHPQAARDILAAGHELGNHSFSHVRNIGHFGDFYRNEIESTGKLLKTAGSDTNLFRPPFGRKLIGLPQAVEEAGLHTVMWDVEDQPEKFTRPKAFAADIVARVQPGSIILIHPMYGHNQVARDALPLILAALGQQGYKVVSVGELLSRSRDTTVANR
jgi:peptidoglycan/xylan/chitin deacetylase (PgdA/CDA1 family)